MMRGSTKQSCVARLDRTSRQTKDEEGKVEEDWIEEEGASTNRPAVGRPQLAGWFVGWLAGCLLG